VCLTFGSRFRAQLHRHPGVPHEQHQPKVADDERFDFRYIFIGHYTPTRDHQPSFHAVNREYGDLQLPTRTGEERTQVVSEWLRRRHGISSLFPSPSGRSHALLEVRRFNLLENGARKRGPPEPVLVQDRPLQRTRLYFLDGTGGAVLQPSSAPQSPGRSPTETAWSSGSACHPGRRRKPGRNVLRRTSLRAFPRETTGSWPFRGKYREFVSVAGGLLPIPASVSPDGKVVIGYFPRKGRWVLPLPESSSLR